MVLLAGLLNLVSAQKLVRVASFDEEMGSVLIIFLQLNAVIVIFEPRRD